MPGIVKPIRRDFDHDRGVVAVVKEIARVLERKRARSHGFPEPLRVEKERIVENPGTNGHAILDDGGIDRTNDRPIDTGYPSELDTELVGSCSPAELDSDRDVEPAGRAGRSE